MYIVISPLHRRRGLNPPHRVKSISMTTFSQQEVEFLQNHGNEVSDAPSYRLLIEFLLVSLPDGDSRLLF